ncbi:LOW QUALITY PROTEIN: Transposable element Tc1 transposase [Frankliniella fusca]|uniref:Transposable element Tc1 transposase n=1 Tax=Frankliniella fusca TaxID=407009 RepID=A0AAE1HPH9_9NEOP|nr:LOW QUALITY PROTEIN: Transposable element Tc1 transposase [Frankliniella fusca]
MAVGVVVMGGPRGRVNPISPSPTAAPGFTATPRPSLGHGRGRSLGRQSRTGALLLCGRGADDFVIGPYVWPNNVTEEEYADFLNHELPHLLENLPLEVRRDMWFQQDGHPAHTSLAARGILHRDFPNRLHAPIGEATDWAPRSPDLTSMDFFLWVFLKDRVYSTPPANRDDLVERIFATCRLYTALAVRSVKSKNRI